MKEADSERWLKREAGKNKGCSESPAISPTIYGKTAAQGAGAVPGCGVGGPQLCASLLARPAPHHAQLPPAAPMIQSAVELRESASKPKRCPSVAAPSGEQRRTPSGPPVDGPAVTARGPRRLKPPRGATHGPGCCSAPPARWAPRRLRLLGGLRSPRFPGGRGAGGRGAAGARPFHARIRPRKAPLARTPHGRFTRGAEPAPPSGAWGAGRRQILLWDAARPKSMKCLSK